MAYTYDTALSNELSKVRFHTGDVGTGGSGAITGAYLADETINYWVGVDATLGEAVIHSLQFIVTQLSTPSFTADGLTIDTSTARAGYEKLLKAKQQEFGVSSGAVATSTIKHAHRADSYEYLDEANDDGLYYDDPSGGRTLSLLGVGQLGRMKAIQQFAMPDTLNVVSYTLTSDSMGGFTSSSSSGSAIGRIGVAGHGDERTIAERLGVDKPYFITLPFGTSVNEKDKITISTRTFEVVSVTSASYSTAVRCLCREIV